MTGQTVADIVRHALLTAFWICLPVLAIGFAAGVLINLLQIVTSIQDPSFSAIPRLLAFLASIVIFLPWMIMKMVAYTSGLLSEMGRYAQ